MRVEQRQDRFECRDEFIRGDAVQAVHCRRPDKLLAGQIHLPVAELRCLLGKFQPGVGGCGLGIRAFHLLADTPAHGARETGFYPRQQGPQADADDQLPSCGGQGQSGCRPLPALEEAQ